MQNGISNCLLFQCNKPPGTVECGCIIILAPCSRGCNESMIQTIPAILHAESQAPSRTVSYATRIHASCDRLLKEDIGIFKVAREFPKIKFNKEKGHEVGNESCSARTNAVLAMRRVSLAVPHICNITISRKPSRPTSPCRYCCRRAISVC